MTHRAEHARSVQRLADELAIEGDEPLHVLQQRASDLLHDYQLMDHDKRARYRPKLTAFMRVVARKAAAEKATGRGGARLEPQTR